MISNRAQKNIITPVLYLCLGIAAFVTIFPFIWMFFSTLKTEAEILQVPLQIFPTQLRLDNYIYVWNSLGIFPRYLFNSAFVTLSVVALNVFFELAGRLRLCQVEIQRQEFPLCRIYGRAAGARSGDVY